MEAIQINYRTVYIPDVSVRLITCDNFDGPEGVEDLKQTPLIFRFQLINYEHACMDRSETQPSDECSWLGSTSGQLEAGWIRYVHPMN